VATALFTVTASMGTLLDGGFAQVDVGKLLAGLAAGLSTEPVGFSPGLGLNPGVCVCVCVRVCVCVCVCVCV